MHLIEDIHTKSFASLKKGENTSVRRNQEKKSKLNISFEMGHKEL